VSEDHPYGSYNVYAKGIKNRLITLSPAYLALSPSDDERQKLYRHFVSQARPQEEFARNLPAGL
jgi:hypothetical protein